MTIRSSLANPSLGREQELELHRRLVEGDHTATADLAEAFFEPLFRWLASHNSKIPEDFCTEAAGDAICALMKNPESYKPGNGNAVGLFAYLQMSAQGDLKNLLNKEARHHRSRKSWESVEQLPEAGKYLAREDDASKSLQIREEAVQAAAQILPSVREGLTAAELRGLELLEMGEKKTAEYAAACGLGHLSQQQQRIEVKRLKDKLNQRIKRARASDGK